MRRSIVQGVPTSLEWAHKLFAILASNVFQKYVFLRQKIAFWAFFLWLQKENGFFEATFLQFINEITI